MSLLEWVWVVKRKTKFQFQSFVAMIVNGALLYVYTTSELKCKENLVYLYLPKLMRRKLPCLQLRHLLKGAYSQQRISNVP